MEQTKIVNNDWIRRAQFQEWEENCLGRKENVGYY